MTATLDDVTAVELVRAAKAQGPVADRAGRPPQTVDQDRPGTALHKEMTEHLGSVHGRLWRIQ
jgi:hypothetical protein